MVEARGAAPGPRPLAGFATAGVLLALALGCATTRVERAGEEARTILLAPLNVFVGMPQELADSREWVTEALRSYLESHGKTVEGLSLAEAQELWGRSIRRVEREGEAASFEVAAQAMARELARRRQFDALVLPALYHRHARADGGAARWDGAEAQIWLRGDDVAAEPPVAVRGYHGRIAAASLFVAIVSPSGRLIQKRLAGLELTEHISVVGGREEPMGPDRWVVETDSPPLDDAKSLRGGIARAFAPFLPAPPEVEGDRQAIAPHPGQGR